MGKGATLGWAEFIDEYARAGAHERSNAQSYTCRLLDLLEVPQPGVAQDDDALNDYVFERRVRSCADGRPRWIDLYKRGCVLMEHKQSRWAGDKAAAFVETLERDPVNPVSLGGWDTLMRNARHQAMSYVAALPPDHAPPVFVVVCDVGRAFEVWADFSGTGRGYAPFPDRKTFRFRHLDLARQDIQQRVRTIFLDPWSLDPSRRAEDITREIMTDLAPIIRRLERRDLNQGAVAHFVMRCVFTLFAADMGLLPKAKLVTLLEDCVLSPPMFAPMMADLWRRFIEPDHEQRFFSGFGEHVPHIGGDVFADSQAFALEADEIARLLRAARRCWRSVEPSIFSGLFEEALAPEERRRLGAHFTPRPYVARIVELTVMQPLRQAWLGIQTKIEKACEDGHRPAAIREAREFHEHLCRTRVLDPACGTGNFLFIAQELMKGLEGEVLDLLTDLGCPDDLELVSVQPRQFLGIELNPRAAKLTDLVLQLGFLQLHYRNHTGHPSEPILQAGSSIRHADALIDWDGAPATRHEFRGSEVVPVWPNARPTVWPDAEFIVGNPPFIGGKDLRSRLDPGYAEALWSVYPQMNESADLVMYWWERAAQALTRPGTSLQRFGLVTTNSITQVFQRRTIERWLTAARPLSLIYAVADHPWEPPTRDAAAVRISITVAEAGRKHGVLLGCAEDGALTPLADPARIHSDLSIGEDVTAAAALKASAGLCSPGVKLHGAGFIVEADDLAAMGMSRRAGLEHHLRPYRNGRDLTGRSRDAWVLDFHGLSAATIRDHFPEAYQRLVEQVKEVRDADGLPIGRDANPRAVYRDLWWVFGEPRGQFRPALEGLGRYIVTVETAKHRLFQFLDAAVIADNMLVCVADDDAATLAVLSSRVHRAWCAVSGGSLEDRPRYTKSRCFDPFPFPRMSRDQRDALRAAGEALDAHRAAVLSATPDLTLTGLYNVLERIEAGAPLSSQDRAVKERGLVLILRDLHRDIDRLTLQAYGWPETATDAEMVQRLVRLNRRRAEEEARGEVAWLRPEYQRPRAVEAQPMAQPLPLEPVAAPAPVLRVFPRLTYEQPLAVRAALCQTAVPQRSVDLARGFKGGRRNTRRIDQALVTLHRYGHVDRLADGRWMAR